MLGVLKITRLNTISGRHNKFGELMIYFVT